MEGFAAGGDRRPFRSQIALEFMIVYSVVLVVFVIVFALIANERSATLSVQESTLMQLVAQNIAGYINQALQAGNGYAFSTALGSGAGTSYNVLVSTTGLVIARTVVGSQTVSGEAVSGARGLVINGTVVGSGNGITLYQLPLYLGYISLSNARGTIFVDQGAPALSTLPGQLTLSTPTGLSAPYFSGSNSFIMAQNSPAFAKGGTPSVGAFTLDTWVYLTSVVPGSSSVSFSQNNPVVSEGSAGKSVFDLGFTGTGTLNSIVTKSGTTYLTGSANVLRTRVLYNIALVCNGLAGSVVLYLNGNSTASSGASCPVLGVSDNVVIGGDAHLAQYMNGYVMDTQFYKAALTQNQIALIASMGPTGSPVSNSVVGWWPLDGNPYDYSGYQDSGIPYNTIFKSVVEVSAQLDTFGGTPATGVPIALATTNGLFGGSNTVQGYTSLSGSLSTLLTPSKGSAGKATVQAEAFNGNLSTISALLGWWPLNLDSGLTGNVYEGEYSGVSVNGTFINKGFGYLQNRTDTYVGLFNGVNTYISSSPVPSAANTLTVAVWIDPNAISQSSFGSGAGGTIIDENEGGGSNGWIFGVKNNNKLWFWPSSGNDKYSTGNIPLNTWTYVVATYNGNSLNLYINGTLDSSQPMSTPQGGATFFKIGAKSWITGYWSGQMANLQLYNRSLTSGQVKQLYLQGLASTPLANQGLVAWWPLSGSPGSYANTQTQYTSTANSLAYNSIVFINQNAQQNATQVPLFNGANSVVRFPSNALPNGNLCNITTTEWVYDSGLPTTSLAGTFDFWSSGSDSVQMNNTELRFTLANSVYTDTWTYSPGYSFKGSWLFMSTVLNDGAVSSYLNGVPVGNPPSNNIGCIDVANGAFGEINGGSTYMNGSIEDVQVYNSVLSQFQLDQLYVQGLPSVAQVNVSYG